MLLEIENNKNDNLQEHLIVGKLISREKNIETIKIRKFKSVFKFLVIRFVYT